MPPMDPTLAAVSDMLAQWTYPATVLVCVVWMGIAIAHATNGARCRYLLLAGSMASAGLAFALLSVNAGRGVWDLPRIMLAFRFLMAATTVLGGGFTILYLLSIRRHSQRALAISPTRPQEEPTA